MLPVATLPDMKSASALRAELACAAGSDAHGPTVPSNVNVPRSLLS